MNFIEDEVEPNVNESDSEISYSEGNYSLSLNDGNSEKVWINKKEQIEDRLRQISKKSSWLDTLHVEFPSNLAYEDPVENDFEREKAFYDQARASAVKAIDMFTKGFPIFRPSDYFAEMAKSDEHMEKVRRKLISIQKSKERRKNSRRLRDEKKFSGKVKKLADERKRKEKGKFLNELKTNRKEMKIKMKLDSSEIVPTPKFSKGNGRGKKMDRNQRDKKIWIRRTEKKGKT